MTLRHLNDCRLKKTKIEILANQFHIKNIYKRDRSKRRRKTRCVGEIATRSLLEDRDSLDDSRSSDKGSVCKLFKLNSNSAEHWAKFERQNKTEELSYFSIQPRNVCAEFTIQVAAKGQGLLGRNFLFRFFRINFRSIRRRIRNESTSVQIKLSKSLFSCQIRLHDEQMHCLHFGVYNAESSGSLYCRALPRRHYRQAE